MGKITGNGEREFFAHQSTVATYFGVTENSICRCYKHLRNIGLIKALPTKSHYQYVPHDEWAKAHPDACAERPLIHWQEDTDPLVGLVWGISAGKLRLLPNYVAKARQYGTDQEIVAMFTAEIEKAKLGGMFGRSPKACWWRVVRELQRQGREIVEL